MTYKNAQDRILARLNLTSSDARTRIKDNLNEVYRRLLGSVGLQKARLTVAGSFNTVAGTYVTAITAAKVLTLTYTALSRVLEQMTLDQIRRLDPAGTRTGAPEAFAVTGQGATTTSVYVWPKPDAIYAVQYEALTAITDLSADGDVPVFPQDFHDILVNMVLAEELLKLEKIELAKAHQEMAEAQTRALRYFLRKSAYLSDQQGSDMGTAYWPFNGPNGWRA